MTDNSGFRVFALDHAAHIRTIRKQLEEIRVTHIEFLLAGSADSFADYRYRVGFLKGVDEALRVCEDIERAERS